MTILQESETRGFFDPVTLGFFVDGDFDKLHYENDDIRLKTKATFFHEITHYLQFYGTTLGNTYLFHQWASLAEKLDFIREIQNTESYIKTPLSRYKHKNPDEFTWVSMQSEKYYQQELYGLTFRLFDYTPLITKDGNPLISSPLIIGVSEEKAYAVVGETILESQATANELIGLAFDLKDQDLAAKTVTSYYDTLPDLEKLSYIIPGQVLAHYKLIHLEPVIYFIVLNQCQIRKLAFRHSEYEMIRAFKRIIESFPHFSKLEPPSNDNDLKDLVGVICNTCNLNNPFDSLSELKKLRESEDISLGKTVSCVSVNVLGWVLENPYKAIYWPRFSIQNLNVPILNVQDENRRFINILSKTISTTISIEHILEYKYYSYLIYLINYLLEKRNFKCPMFIESKPSVCRSCEKCSGYIPDNEIKEDCPQCKILMGQGIYLYNIKKEEE